MNVTEKTYEMFWDCRYCAQKKNLGLSHRHCPGCGGPQDPNARYFPSDAEKVAAEDHPYVGADLHCPACRFANSRNSRCCASCGSPLAGAQGVALRPEPGMHGASPQPFAYAPNVAPAPGMGGAPAFSGAKKPFPWRYLLVPLVVGVVLFVGCLYAVFKTRPGELVVQARSWERSIAVDRNELERVTAWCDSVPAGSRVIAKRRAQHGTEKIPDGETCTTRKRDQGNGTFKETRECTKKYKDKPVYDDECDYETPRWRTVRTERATGSAAEAPRWPAVRLGSTGGCVGCEREGTRAEKYILKMKEPKTGETHDCELAEGKWGSFNVGDHCAAEVGAVFGNLDCTSLKKR